MRGSKSLSSTAFMTLAVFLLSGVIFRPSAFAAESVSGIIQSIQPLENGRIEIRVQGAESGVFIVTGATQIEALLSARDVKPGHRITLAGTGGGGGGSRGLKGMKDPFEKIPDGLKKDLGLPDMPSIPEVPAVPEIPQIPEIPEIPQVPKKQPPEGLPAEQGMPPGLGAAGPAAGGREPGRGDPLPLADETLPDSGDESKVVLEARATDGGIEINLEGEEKVVIPADAPVKQFLTPADLRENMNVVFTMEEMNGEKVVQRLQVV